MTLLIITAVENEAEALRQAAPASITIAAVGAGPAAAAAGAARLLATGTYEAVISAGIAGAFKGRADIADLVLATRSIAADLGAESPTGFLPIDTLGFGTTTIPADPALLKTLQTALPTAKSGDILTLATVTGTAETTARLATTHPEALAEAMEGHGVATAAKAAGVPFAELRAISNLIGPRDRESWRLKEAFEALSNAAADLRW